MTEPQVWTLIGVFAAVMLGSMTLMTTLLTRTMNAGFTAVDAKFDAVDAKFDAVGAKFDAVGARFDAVDARFDAVDARIDHLDRDVTAIVHRLLGDPPAA